MPSFASASPKPRFSSTSRTPSRSNIRELQTRLFGLPFTIPPCRPGLRLTGGQRLQLGSLEVVVIHTPGHSPGHVVYHFPKENLLIGGDLIIGGSIGRTDLPDSDPVEMQASLRKVMALPDQTRLLGGHGPPTTLGEERRTNPFLRDSSRRDERR